MGIQGSAERLEELRNMDHEGLARFALMCDRKLNDWGNKFGYLQAGSLDKPLSWFQKCALDGIRWRIGLWFKRNMP